jgi:transcriptional regulator with PAS, ATPase and Fis domain
VIVSLGHRHKEYAGFDSIKIKTLTRNFMPQDIMSIDDYVVFILQKFQSTISDTKIAKALKIDRKTLWNKRHKLGVKR